MKKKTMYPYYKRFDMQITSANKSYTAEFELDKDVHKVKGVLLTSDQDDQLYYRGAQQLSINGREYLPENYESKLLMCGVNVDPNKRFYELDEAETLNGKIKITYTDTDNVNVSFNAYRVSIYIKAYKEGTR